MGNELPREKLRSKKKDVRDLKEKKNSEESECNEWNEKKGRRVTIYIERE